MARVWVREAEEGDMASVSHLLIGGIEKPKGRKVFWFPEGPAFPPC